MTENDGNERTTTYEFMPSIVVEVQAASVSEAEEIVRQQMIGLELDGRIVAFLGSGMPAAIGLGEGPSGVGIFGEMP